MSGGDRRRWDDLTRTQDLTDVQRLGMETASRVIDGFVDLLAVQRDSTPAAADLDAVDGNEPTLAQLRINVARALDLYTDLVRRSFDSYADLMEQQLRGRGVQLTGVDDGWLRLLTMRGAAGMQATGTAWIHNATDESASVVLRLTDLTCHDGRIVPACAGTFDPPKVTVEAGGSVPSRLAIGLDDVTPGTYRGHVLLGGLPDAALPVALVIADGAPGPPQ